MLIFCAIQNLQIKKAERRSTTRENKNYPCRRLSLGLFLAAPLSVTGGLLLQLSGKFLCELCYMKKNINCKRKKHNMVYKTRYIYTTLFFCPLICLFLPFFNPFSCPDIRTVCRYIPTFSTWWNVRSTKIKSRPIWTAFFCDKM